ncbi:hypothetical protein JYU34_017774 [Plutella xylostella]|uniref:Major facilitator superfamily (MFS) profile domain-containing protein n=1 Tax=Plutella xylostella TaxID=51655 RepID=A0ABQ7Q224_PLUXY|nr:hypothetical protein JYU34_017774 [Plutella xylostella]
MADSSRVGSRKASAAAKCVDLDDVLVNELGQFGRYQIFNILLVSLPIIMSAFMSEYIFSAANVPHRCAIPECDGPDPVYEPSWALNALPAVQGRGFSNCRRFALLSNTTVAPPPNTCPASLFDRNTQVDCEEYVYGKTNSVVYDFGLECQEWLRALAGTLSSVGTLLVLPFTGYVSDRFGRRVALIVSVFNLALIGLVRAFSVNYAMYLTLQIMQTTLGAGTFSSAYVFATELVGPKYRVLASAICSSMFAVGQVILGSVAWLIQPWRYMIMALHIPCFIIIGYYWILPESVRWLLSKKRFQEAKEILEKVARVNRKQISDASLNALCNPPALEKTDEKSEEEKPSLLRAIGSSRILLRRVCTTPIWWVTTTFVYYGLSINSTGLSGNIYLNYIYVCAIEIPGFATAVLILNRIGRKPTLTFGYFLSAACNIAFAFIDDEQTTVRLVLFLIGKFGISVVFTSLYLFTSELYPTEYRHSLLAFSSMIGRVGSITAPLTPALRDIWTGLPSMLFGGMGLLAGLLVLTQPETLGTSMPDTLAEAEAIGTEQSKR